MHTANFGSPNRSLLVMPYGEMSWGEEVVLMIKGGDAYRLLSD